MKDPSNPVCRTISTLLSRIGDKWTVLVVQTSAKAPGASTSYAGKSRASPSAC
jgi:DNA-binding HxlR family transcriptional regulator